MNIELLSQLAAAVEAAADETIDLDTWECDTCFCALGLAASLGIGGLRFGDGCFLFGHYPVTRDGRHAGAAAAAEVFDLDDDTAEWLFDQRGDEDNGDGGYVATDRQIWLSRCRNLMLRTATV